jgi:hypothetical protein
MDARRLTTYVPLGAALLTAAVLQAILIARAPTISADGIIFTSIARDLSEAPVATFRKYDQHPGYPAAMLAATRAAEWLGYRGEPEAWMLGGRAVSYVCGLVGVLVVWLFARDLYDAKVANVAAFVMAVLPLPRLYASDAQSDMPHTMVYLIAAWLATLGIQSGRLWPLVGAGLASGIAYWIRPEGLEVFAVAMLFVAWRGVRAQWPWRRAGLAAATLAAATLLVAAPYPLLAGKITSKQLPFFKPRPAPTFIEQMAAKPDERATEAPARAAPSSAVPVRPDAAVSPAPVAAVGAAPQAARVEPRPAAAEHGFTFGLVARIGAEGFGQLIECFCYGFRYVFIPLYLLGQWEMVRRGTPRPIIAFLWVLASLHMLILLWVFYVSGYIASRHVLPLVGLAMPFTALGILYAGEKLGHLVNVRPSRAAVATLAVCSLVVLPYSTRAYNHEFLPVIAATRWVQAHAAPGSGIVCNSPYVGYYGGLPTTVLGPEALSLDAALARGKSGVRYDFVVLHVGAHGYHPEWLPQIETRYRQVLEYRDPAWPSQPRKVMVFEATGNQARRTPDPRS